VYVIVIFSEEEGCVVWEYIVPLLNKRIIITMLKRENKMILEITRLFDLLYSFINVTRENIKSKFLSEKLLVSWILELFEDTIRGVGLD